MGVNSLPKTVTRQHRDCDLNPNPTAPESSMLHSATERSSLVGHAYIAVIMCFVIHSMGHRP